MWSCQRTLVCLFATGFITSCRAAIAKLTVFEDDRDRQRFVEIVAIAAERYTVEVLAECRMGNHYHMVVRTPLANLSLFMAYVNGKFTQFSNRRHRRTGHLFNGPYKPILVDDDLYFKVVLVYVVMNPVAAGLVDAPEKWQWSSYRATAGILNCRPATYALIFCVGHSLHPRYSNRSSRTANS